MSSSFFSRFIFSRRILRNSLLESLQHCNKLYLETMLKNTEKNATKAQENGEPLIWTFCKNLYIDTSGTIA